MQPWLLYASPQFHDLITDINSHFYSVDEECVQNGVEFIPIRLTQKKPRGTKDEVNQGRASKHGGGGNSMWEPASSDKDDSDSEDSMSDLYPRQYTLCTPFNRHEKVSHGILVS